MTIFGQSRWRWKMFEFFLREKKVYFSGENVFFLMLKSKMLFFPPKLLDSMLAVYILCGLTTRVQPHTVGNRIGPKS